MTKNYTENNNFREFNFFNKNLRIILSKEIRLTIKLLIRDFKLKIEQPLMMIDFLNSILEAFLVSPALRNNYYGSFCK